MSSKYEQFQIALFTFIKKSFVDLNDFKNDQEIFTDQTANFYVMVLLKKNSL